MKQIVLHIFMVLSLMTLVLAETAMAGGFKKKSKVILSGNLLANSQVVPVGGQAKTVMAGGAGKFRFQSTMYCGDGDVAHYAEENPTTEFYPSTDPDTNIIVGYWMSPAGGAIDLSPSKFFSIGYVTDAKIDSDVTERLLAVNFSDQPRRQTFALIKEAMQDAASIAEAATSANISGLASTNYNMKFVAMACPTFKNTSGIGGTSGMNNLKINRQFISGLNLVGTTNLKDYMHDSMIEANGSISKTRFNVNTAGSGNPSKSIELQFTGSGSESLSFELVNLINDLASASKPPVHVSTVAVLTPSASGPVPMTCNCDRLSYSADLASLKARFENFKNRFNQAQANKSICDASPGINFTATDYPWEIYRTNAACQMYHKVIAEEIANFEAAINDLFANADTNKNACTSVSPTSVYPSCPASLNLTNISDNEYRQRKVQVNKKLLKIAGTPNAIQVAQDRLKSLIASNPAVYALNQGACFPLTAGSGEFVKYIGSSVGINIDPDPDVAGSLLLTIDKAPVVHPEPFFAIGGDAPYLTPSGNSLAVFNNANGDAKFNSSFKVSLGMSSFVTATTGTANATFKIRSIGCSQNVYCYNGR